MCACISLAIYAIIPVMHFFPAVLFACLMNKLACFGSERKPVFSGDSNRE